MVFAKTVPSPVLAAGTLKAYLSLAMTVPVSVTSLLGMSSSLVTVQKPRALLVGLMFWNSSRNGNEFTRYSTFEVLTLTAGCSEVTGTPAISMLLKNDAKIVPDWAATSLLWIASSVAPFWVARSFWNSSMLMYTALLSMPSLPWSPRHGQPVFGVGNTSLVSNWYSVASPVDAL